MGCCWSSKERRGTITGWAEEAESANSATPRPPPGTELLGIPKKVTAVAVKAPHDSSHEPTLHEVPPSDPAECNTDISLKVQSKIPGSVGQDVARDHGHGVETRAPLASMFSSDEDIEHAAVIHAVVRAHLARKHKQREHESFSILRVPMQSRAQASLDSTSSLLIPHVPAGSVKTKAQVPRGGGGIKPILSTSVSGLRGQLTFSSPTKAQPQQPPD